MFLKLIKELISRFVEEFQPKKIVLMDIAFQQIPRICKVIKDLPIVGM